MGIFNPFDDTCGQTCTAKALIPLLNFKAREQIVFDNKCQHSTDGKVLPPVKARLGHFTDVKSNSVKKIYLLTSSC